MGLGEGRDSGSEQGRDVEERASLLTAAYSSFAHRVYKFGGQPFVNDYLTHNYKSSFTSTFGERNGKSVMSATAGR